MKIQTLERKVVELRIVTEMRKCTETCEVLGNEIVYEAEFLADVTFYVHCKYLQPIYSHWVCYISQCNFAKIITANGFTHNTQ